MSSPRTHIIQSVITSAGLYSVIRGNAVPFGLAVVFIDIDHCIAYVADTGSFNLRGFFLYHRILENNLGQKNFLGLNLFHTIEFYALLLLLGNKFPSLYYITAGCLSHHLVDEWALITKHQKPFARAFSIFEYFLRKKTKKYITSIKGLLQEDNLNLTGISNLNNWLTNWHIDGKYNP